MLARMYKSFLVLLLFLFAQYTFSQSLDSALLKSALCQLEIGQDKCFMSLVSSLEIPKGETILVIPEIEESGDEYAILNSHILILDNSTGSIKSRFFNQKAWYTDAERINSIKISYQPYKLNPIFPSIGIVINYEVNSRVNPRGVDELNLYVRNGENIEVVLEKFAVNKSIGDRIALESVAYEVHNKLIESSSIITNGYYDLVVKHSISNFQFIDGEKKNITNKLETEVLKYENGTYRLRKN